MFALYEINIPYFTGEEGRVWSKISDQVKWWRLQASSPVDKGTRTRDAWRAAALLGLKWFPLNTDFTVRFNGSRHLHYKHCSSTPACRWPGLTPVSMLWNLYTQHLYLPTNHLPTFLLLSMYHVFLWKYRHEPAAITHVSSAHDCWRTRVLVS